MIIVYPLVVSKTVNPNIIPGICKSLEKYVYIHKLDSVLEVVNAEIRRRTKKSNTYLSLKAVGSMFKLKLENIEHGKTIDDYLLESKQDEYEKWFLEDDSLLEAKKGRPQEVSTQVQGPADSDGNITTRTSSPSRKPTKKDAYDSAFQKSKGEADFKKTQVVNEPPQIGRMEQTSITSEPTWNTVVDQQGNTHAIGVKVVPFIIQNEQSLVKLMTLDRYRSKLSKDLHKQGRKLLRWMHGLANKAWKKTIGLLSWTGFVDKSLVKGTLTTNWKNDIILQNTYFKDKLFILLNKMDLDDENFTTSASGIKRLFTLGWTSFIIADDINKIVSFCMESYKGMCSMINYGFLYADVRSQSQVYQDIEDIKRSAGPLFRMKRRKKSMITDNLAQYKLDQYSQDILISESYLNESVVPDLMKNIKESPKQLASNLKSMVSAVKRNDMKSFSKIVNKINPKNKKMELNKIINKLNNISPDFKKNYTLAERVFKNSLPGLQDDMIKAGSATLASIAVLNKNKKYNFKNDLKKVVTLTRSKLKSQSEDNDDFNRDLRVAYSFAIVLVVCTGIGVIGVIYALATAIPIIGSAIASYWLIIASLIGLVYAGKNLAGGLSGND